MQSFIQSDMRDMNRQAIYHILTSIETISKAEIARISGISAPTVSKVINYFLECELVYECSEEGGHGIGRKPQMLKFNPNAYYSVGVIIDGSFLKISLVNLEGKIVDSKSALIDRQDCEWILDEGARKYIRPFIEATGIARERILGICIGIPGIVDSSTRTIVDAKQLGIHDALCVHGELEKLEDYFNLPIYLENSVSASAVGECVSRSLDQNTELIYISLGIGLRAGIVIGGKIRKGRNNFAGEIGYAVFDENYTYREEKAGWFESRVGLPHICERFDLNNEDFIEAYRFHSGKMLGRKKEIIEYIAPKLALCIINFVLPLDIDLIVLGGIVSEILEYELAAAIVTHTQRLTGKKIALELKSCESPGLVGAAKLVIDARMDDLLAGETSVVRWGTKYKK